MLKINQNYFQSNYIFDSKTGKSIIYPIPKERAGVFYVRWPGACKIALKHK